MVICNRFYVLVGFIRRDLSIHQPDDPVSMKGNILFMRNNDDRVSHFMDLFKQAKNFDRSFGIKISCWFIRKN